MRVGFSLALAVSMMASPTRAAQSGAAVAPTVASAPDAGLSLAEAVEVAFEKNPRLALAKAAVEQARAEGLSAGTYPFNPEMSLRGARRRAPLDDSTDRAVELSQEIEIGGQRQRRRAVAESALAAAEAELRFQQRLLAGGVAVAFAAAIEARELLRIDEADAALARDLLAIEERRLSAGKTTQIELNLARAVAGRALRGVELAKGAYRVACTELAETIGMPAAAPPEPVGELGQGLAGSADLPPLAELVRAALEHREDLAAWRARERASVAVIALERSLARPNLSLSVFSEREAGTDDLYGVALGLGIPLFNRNRGPVAEAAAAAQGVAAESALARLAVERDVAAAHAVFLAASTAATGLRQLVVGSLEENLGLLQKSLEAGKTSLGEIFLLRREFVEGQRELVKTLGDAWRARVELDLATSRLPFFAPAQRSSEP